MKGKYSIVLFKNKKRLKVMYFCQKLNTVERHWKEFKSEKKPPFVNLQGGARNRKGKIVYELALLVPWHHRAKNIIIRDNLGRNVEAVIDNKKYRIKEIIPYWMEETVYDFQTKNRLRYHELLNIILEIQDIGQIFLLNNKLCVQVEDDIKMYGNKNLNDSNRLFELLKNDILKKERGNFIFVKDVSTEQRKKLYDLLTSKGFKKTELFRHYSY